MAWVIANFNGSAVGPSINGSEEYSVSTSVLVPTLVLEIDFPSLILPVGDFNRIRAVWVDLEVEIVIQAQPPSFKRYVPADSNQFFPALEVRYADPAGRVTAITQVRSSGVVLPQAHYADGFLKDPAPTQRIFNSLDNSPTYGGYGGLYATKLQIFAQRGQVGFVNYKIWEFQIGKLPVDDAASYTLSCGSGYFTY